MDRSLDKKTEILVIQAEGTMINIPTVLQNQVLATNFFVPAASGPVIARPRLTNLLDESLKYPLTLISAPAGFGKTTLAASWAQSLEAKHLQLAWVSLDEEDNDLRLFWSYIVAALQIRRPKRFSSLLAQLQSPYGPPLKYILIALINLLAESMEQFVLILDDYQMITKQEIHNALVYLIEHLSSQLHIVVVTRTDPAWPLSQLRARQQILEVRGQLRCTAEETKAFFQEVMDMEFPDEMIQEITARTEGWLVGLQLLGLSLPERADPLMLLKEVSGDQRYILDYLTEEVLQRQEQDVQTFLLYTSILDKLSCSLCDAVMDQHGSQQMLERLERANLFVVSLDSKREWYRYHALFAEALRYWLEQCHGDLVPNLHHRASLWYAKHEQTTQAIAHALQAQCWSWAADLIEGLPVQSFLWGSAYELALLRRWLEQLPADIVSSRPRLCLLCSQVVAMIVPASKLQAWLSTAEEILTASLAEPKSIAASDALFVQKLRKKQENLLGEIIAWRTFHCSLEGDHVPLSHYQQAFALLSADNHITHAFVRLLLSTTYYTSEANDAINAIKTGMQAVSFAHATRQNTFSIDIMCITAHYLLGTGQLHEAEQLTQQAKRLKMQPGCSMLLEVGWPTACQAQLLGEWNDLDAACTLIEEAIEQCKQTELLASPIALTHLALIYAAALRIYLSCRDYEAARTVHQQFERLGMKINQQGYLFLRAFWMTIDQVRLWLACGELERARYWVKKLDEEKRQGTPFAREREEVACARVLLAQDQPALARERLEPALQRATEGQRWGHVIEIRILQALAYQMQNEEVQALDVLSQAIGLAEPEGYIRSFVDEGASMERLLSRLQKAQRKAGSTAYLDKLLLAFRQKSGGHEPQPKRLAKHTTVHHHMLESLSLRELEVLRLLACGASNQEVACKLVIAVDTVKRHVSHIFAKLDVQNRVQAVRQAQAHGLLNE